MNSEAASADITQDEAPLTEKPSSFRFERLTGAKSQGPASYLLRSTKAARAEKAELSDEDQNAVYWKGYN